MARPLRALTLAAAFLAACASAPATQPAQTTQTASAATAVTATSQATAAAGLTLSCASPAAATTEMTEGPYFTAGSPQKSSLVSADMKGTRIVLTGYVLTTSCQPLSGAKVDIWQADASGNYDNSGYTLRGHVLTAADGSYRIETIVPGEYPGRTEHIHVKVSAGGTTITTQVFFPGQSSNSGDGIYRAENLLKITDGTPLVGRFDFVLKTA